MRIMGTIECLIHNNKKGRWPVNQRRKRIGRRLRNLQLSLQDVFNTDCQGCWDNSVCCRHPEFFHLPGCPDEGDGCSACPHFTGLCNPSSTCPGSQDAIWLARTIVHGDPWERVEFTA